MELTATRNGIYRSVNATYYVKDGKFLANIKGTFYKVDPNFFFGAVYQREFTPGQLKSFDAAYTAARKW